MIIKKIVGRICRECSRFFNMINMRLEGIHYGKGCNFCGCIYASGNVIIEDKVKINSGKRYNVIGGEKSNHP